MVTSESSSKAQAERHILDVASKSKRAENCKPRRDRPGCQPGIRADRSDSKGRDWNSGQDTGAFTRSAGDRSRSALPMTFHIRKSCLVRLSLTVAILGVFSTGAVATAQDVHLQCEGEARSRLLAFAASGLENETERRAEKRLQIKIHNARRATILDMPSGDILFGPSQCRMSDMKLACETSEDGHHRQMFISRTSGDAIFEGYTETADEKSALLVEHYRCTKEDREPIF